MLLYDCKTSESRWYEKIDFEQFCLWYILDAHMRSRMIASIFSQILCLLSSINIEHALRWLSKIFRPILRKLTISGSTDYCYSKSVSLEYSERSMIKISFLAINFTSIMRPKIWPIMFNLKLNLSHQIILNGNSLIIFFSLFRYIFLACLFSVLSSEKLIF